MDNILQPDPMWSEERNGVMVLYQIYTNWNGRKYDSEALVNSNGLRLNSNNQTNALQWISYNALMSLIVTWINICYLSAKGRSVWWKTVTEVLKMTFKVFKMRRLFWGRDVENAAPGRRPRAAFSRPRSQFFTIRTDPWLINNICMYIFSLTLTKFFPKEPGWFRAVNTAR